MYYKAAVLNFKKHFFLIVIMILQLSIMMAIIISLAGAVQSRLKHYLPLKAMLDGNGYICSGVYDMSIKESVNDKLTGVNEVHTVGSTALFTENNAADTQFGAYVYDDYTAALYSPELAEGKWLDDFSDKTGEIPIVLSDNGCGYKTGDTLSMNCYIRNSDEMLRVSFRVIGILEDGSDYILANANEMLDPNSDDMLYKSFYYNRLDELIESGYSDEEAQQYLEDESSSRIEMSEFFDDVGYGKTGNNIKMYNEPKAFIREKDAEVLKLQITNYTLIVSLKDDLSSSQQHDALYTLKNDSGFDTLVIPFSKLNKNSIEKIKLQLVTSAPLIMISLVLILLSSISIGAVSTMQQLKIYGIYYLNGSKWLNCLRVSLYSSLMICLPSLVIAYTGLFVLKKIGPFSDLTVSFGLFENISAIVIALIFILLSLIMPYFILKRKTPKNILSEN